LIAYDLADFILHNIPYVILNYDPKVRKHEKTRCDLKNSIDEGLNDRILLNFFASIERAHKEGG
jgi:hypothetical protein